MSIDFGVVSKYFEGKGFGFVSRTFKSGHQPEVFFHIKAIKKTYPGLAERIDDNDPDGFDLCFWYEAETTAKGEQVRSVLRSDAVQNKLAGELPRYVKAIEEAWANADVGAFGWLHEASVDLVGIGRADQLRAKREVVERRKQQAIAAEKAKRETAREAARRAEEAELKKFANARKAQEDIKEAEFKRLVEEMRPLGFAESKDVSRYIMDNRLGMKYPNISGVVKMARGADKWDFYGGFPPDIYARLCEELSLDDQGTLARAVGFDSFNELAK